MGVLGRRRRRAALVLAVVALAGGCSDDGGGGGDDDDGGDGGAAVVPAIEEIGAAIAAVDAARGGPQSYFEVNATGRTVNLFVATDGATTVTPYRYLAGELLAPDPASTASGPTFTADAVAFDPATVLDRIAGELDDPVVARFAIAAAPDGTPQYFASVVSEQGGTLEVTLGPDGSIQAVDPG